MLSSYIEDDKLVNSLLNNNQDVEHAIENLLLPERENSYIEPYSPRSQNADDIEEYIELHSPRLEERDSYEILITDLDQHFY